MRLQEIDAQELATLLNTNENIHLIDVRNHNEIIQGQLAKAKHLPLHLLPLKMIDIPKNDKVIFYCHSGARSAQACSFLNAKGHDNVINLRGGILNWARNGLPITQH
ncbi:MAG: rhodanese-like domain-containing protein [Methylococcales bacterium]|jgi:rhodanese-related sulfurtransferase|nr:rhodanese-like domain-containing protein [Methylococcales bacterium]MBT7409548.1 rhodanese-like domain-containing protein [Methylococcales bacterium]